MRLRYFVGTDTLYIELRDGVVAEIRDFDENTLIDVDDEGRLVAITIERANERTEPGRFVCERVDACTVELRPPSSTSPTSPAAPSPAASESRVIDQNCNSTLSTWVAEDVSSKPVKGGAFMCVKEAFDLSIFEAAGYKVWRL